MKYKILKEDKPSKTIKRIEKILKNIGAFVQEQHFLNQDTKFKTLPVATRICLYGVNTIGTNGKGTCIENARASAFAEFMERLQNQTILSSDFRDFIFAPDEEFCEASELKNMTFSNCFGNDLILEKLNILANKVVNASGFHKKQIDETQTLLLPFFNVKDKKIIKLPYKIIRLLQITTGMSAGNTKEEALVQALSEICERYSVKKFYKDKIIFPDIPLDAYIKYDAIVEMKKYYESIGYIVHIKDASLGLKFLLYVLLWKTKIIMFVIPLSVHILVFQ